jgi:hypothetical protein
MHASRGIRTHDPSNQAAKIHVLDRAATGIGQLRRVKHLNRATFLENTCFRQPSTFVTRQQLQQTVLQYIYLLILRNLQTA